MSLSSPVPRRRIHSRTIECVGYEREDGLWDIEGHLTDAKTERLVRPESGRIIEPGVSTHDMWVRFTIDVGYTIHRVEVAMDAGRYPICSEILPNFQRLVGLTIGPGFNKAVKNLVGNVEGCTHLNELIGRMAMTTYQSTSLVRAQREGYNNENRGRRLINTCRAYASDSPAVLERFPNLFTGVRPPSKS